MAISKRYLINRALAAVGMGAHISTQPISTLTKRDLIKHSLAYLGFGPAYTITGDTPTKRELINRAFEALGLASYVFDMAPEEYNSALAVMDDMVNATGSVGQRTGYIPANGLDATSGVLPQFAQVIWTNLALELAPSYGKQPGDAVVRTAQESTVFLNQINLNMTDAEITNLLVRMDNMVAGWGIIGQRTGYSLTATIDQAAGVYRQFADAIIANMAIIAAPMMRVPVGPGVAEAAQASYAMLQNTPSNVSADEYTLCLQTLDGMMAGWDGTGLRLGYIMPSDPDSSLIDGDSGLPDTAINAVSMQLAKVIAPFFNRDVPMATALAADTAFRELRARYSEIPVMRPSATVPLGAGNKPWMTGYGPALDDAPPVDQVDINREGVLNG